MSGVPFLVGLHKGATFETAIGIGSHNLEQALTYISSNAISGDKYYIVLGENQNCSPKSLSYPNKVIDITLMADGIERTVQLGASGSLFTVNNGITLILENNVSLRGRDNTASLVKINGSGTFIMSGGKISGNTASSSYGGGVYNAGGTFTMSGGEISGNTASSYSSYSSSSSSYGGGVYIDGGTFTMSGGEISGNTASTSYSSSSSSSSGGGVYNAGGTFTMSGGEISGNTASSSSSYYSSSCGGGVYSSGTFTMSGGEISGNTASSSSSSSGGGVYSSGTFTMSGGEISGNTASSSSSSSSSSGGGVSVDTGGTFTMSGGEISGNTVASASASVVGGGVYSGGTFTKMSDGGVITGYGNNTTTGNKVVVNGVVQSNRGHAVYVYSNPAKKLENTVIAGRALDSNSTSGWTD